MKRLLSILDNDDSDEFFRLGEFFTEKNLKERFPGILTYSPVGGLKLQVNEFPDLPHEGMIFGEIGNNEYCILIFKGDFNFSFGELILDIPLSLIGNSADLFDGEVESITFKLSYSKKILLSKAPKQALDEPSVLFELIDGSDESLSISTLFRKSGGRYSEARESDVQFKVKRPLSVNDLEPLHILSKWETLFSLLLASPVYAHHIFVKMGSSRSIIRMFRMIVFDSYQWSKYITPPRILQLPFSYIKLQESNALDLWRKDVYEKWGSFLEYKRLPVSFSSLESSKHRLVYLCAMIEGIFESGKCDGIFKAAKNSEKHKYNKPLELFSSERVSELFNSISRKLLNGDSKNIGYMISELRNDIVHPGRSSRNRVNLSKEFSNLTSRVFLNRLLQSVIESYILDQLGFSKEVRDKYQDVTTDAISKKSFGITE